jgi:WD40 repeat protein
MSQPVRAENIEGDLILFDRSDRDAVHRTTRHAYSEQVRAVSYSPDGHWIATAAEQGPLLLWPTDSLDAEPVPCPVIMAGAITWSPDGSLLIVGGNAEVAVMNRRLEVVHRIEAPDLVKPWTSIRPAPASPLRPPGHQSSSTTSLAVTGSGWTTTSVASDPCAGPTTGACSQPATTVRRWFGRRTHAPSRTVSSRVGAPYGTLTVHGQHAYTVTSTGMLAWHDLTSGTTQGHLAFDTAPEQLRHDV